jgi:hypothetical protein
MTILPYLINLKDNLQKKGKNTARKEAGFTDNDMRSYQNI